MADDMASLLSACASELQNDGEATSLTAHVVAALKHFRGKHYSFAEKTGSWSSTAGVQSYTPGSNSMPADVLKVFSVTLIESSKRTLLPDPITVDEMRQRRQGIPANGKPSRWTWFADKLIFDVPTVASLTLEIDYLMDATRDAAGALITAASATTVTNAFFVRGEELLRARVLWSYALGRGNNPDLAQRMAAVGESAHASLIRQRDQAKTPRQAPAHF